MKQLNALKVSALKLAPVLFSFLLISSFILIQPQEVLAARSRSKQILTTKTATQLTIAITPLSAPPIPPSTCIIPGDGNGDGIVNGVDITLVSQYWLRTGTDIPGDVNHDGIVNSQDIAMIASNWGANAATLCNNPPVATPQSNLPGTVNHSMVITLSGTDPDAGDSITSYQIVSMPQHGGATLQSNLASYTPATNFAGSDSFTFRVMDTHNAWSQPATISMRIVMPPNNPPVWSALPSQMLTATMAFSYTLPAATDADNDPLTYSATGLPSGATFTAATRTLDWTPSQTGNFSMTFSVSDGKASLSQTLSLTVNPFNSSVVTMPGPMFVNTQGPYWYNKATSTYVAYTNNPPFTAIQTSNGWIYKLTSSIRFSGMGIYIAGHDITFDLNGFTIYYGSDNALLNPVGAGTDPGNDHAINLYLPWKSLELPYPWWNGADNEALNFVLKNGSIVHEGTQGFSHGVYGGRAETTTITNMRIKTNGTDSHPIALNYGSTLNLTNSVLIATATDTYNRMAAPANVWAPGVNVTATNNVLIGDNCGFYVGSGSQITKNVISHAGYDTDGYGVFTYNANYKFREDPPGSNHWVPDGWAGTSILVKDNLIIPTAGRGILINRTIHLDATGNVILSLEHPNREFGRNLNAPAYRSRYTSYDNTFIGNTTLGIGSDAATASQLTSASGMYLSNSGTDWTGAIAHNTYTDNKLTTILIGATEATSYVQPITLEGNGANVNDGNPLTAATDVISGNVCNSNLYQIRTGGSDGVANQATPLVGNTFNWMDGISAANQFIAAAQQKLTQIGMGTNPDAVSVVSSMAAKVHSLIDGVGLNPDRKFWYTQYYKANGYGNATSVTGEYATILDSTFDAGVDPSTFFQRGNFTGTVADRWGQTVQVKLVDASGAPIANKAVTLSTNVGDLFDYPTLMTDSSGKVGLPIITAGIDKAVDAMAPMTVDLRATSTITVSGRTPLTFYNSALIQQAQAGVVTLTM